MKIFVPHRKHQRIITFCYGDSFAFFMLGYVYRIRNVAYYISVAGHITAASIARSLVEATNCHTREMLSGCSLLLVTVLHPFCSIPAVEVFYINCEARHFLPTFRVVITEM
jgi:DUF1365 family protein